MDSLAPLIELRGEWRSAAATSMPAAAAEIAGALDRAVDVLSNHDQLDPESLMMAADVVCNALEARPDEVELLRRRLHRAVRDYAAVATLHSPQLHLDGGAFADEEALAAALGQVGNDVGPGAAAPMVTPAVTVSHDRVDERALARALRRSTRRPRRWPGTVVRLIVVLAVAAGVIAWLLIHPPTVVVQPPTSNNQPTTNLTAGVSGSLDASGPRCTGGGSTADHGCSWPLVVQKAGSLTFALRWDTADPLTLTVIDAKGQVVGPSTTSTQGQMRVTTPPLPAGSYAVSVIGPVAPSQTIAFTLTEAP